MNKCNKPRNAHKSRYGLSFEAEQHLKLTKVSSLNCCNVFREQSSYVQTTII